MEIKATAIPEVKIVTPARFGTLSRVTVEPDVHWTGRDVLDVSHVWNANIDGSIAFDYRFNSPTHFGRVFRSRFGVTPREYRRTPPHDA